MATDRIQLSEQNIHVMNVHWKVITTFQNKLNWSVISCMNALRPICFSIFPFRKCNSVERWFSIRGISRTTQLLQGSWLRWSWFMVFWWCGKGALTENTLLNSTVYRVWRAPTLNDIGFASCALAVTSAVNTTALTRVDFMVRALTVKYIIERVVILFAAHHWLIGWDIFRAHTARPNYSANSL